MSAYSALRQSYGLEALKAVILQRSPMAYWICNEESGSTIADHSGNGYDLTVTGSPDMGVWGLLPVNEPYKYLTIKSGSINGAARSGTLGFTPPISHPWSLEMVVRPLVLLSTTPSGAQNLFAICGSGETEAVNYQLSLQLYRNAIRSFTERLAGTDIAILSDECSFSPGVAVHLGLSRSSATTVTWYLNGRRLTDDTGASTLPTGGSSANTCIGAASTAHNFAIGHDIVIGHVAVYNTNLVESDYRKSAMAAGLWGSVH